MVLTELVPCSGWKNLHSLDFVPLNFPLLPKETSNQVYPANQTQELNSPKTSRKRDSPHSHQRGTDLQHQTPRRLPPEHYRNNTVLSSYKQVSPEHATSLSYQLMTASSRSKMTKLKKETRIPKAWDAGPVRTIFSWLCRVRDECSKNKSDFVL